MKFLATTLLFTFLSISLFAQDHPVRIDIEKGEKSIKFYAVSDLNETQQVELTLTEKKGLKGYTKPVVKNVAPGERKLLLTTTFSGAYKYNTSYRWAPNPTKVEQQAKAEMLADKVLKDFGDIKTGIVVFEKNNCSRCNMSTSYLLDNDIEFKMIDVSEGNSDGNRLMWDLIKADGHKAGQSILTPVFLVDGKLSHTHKDLQGFLKSLLD